jgi:hypothetical protein
MNEIGTSMTSYEWAEIFERARHNTYHSWLENTPKEDECHFISLLSDAFNIRFDEAMLYIATIAERTNQPIAFKLASIALSRHRAGSYSHYTMMASLIDLYYKFVRPCKRCKTAPVFTFMPKDYFFVCEECNKGVDNHV